MVIEEKTENFRGFEFLNNTKTRKLRNFYFTSNFDSSCNFFKFSSERV